MSIGPISRAPSFSLPNLGSPAGAPAFAKAAGSPFAKDTFQPAAAGAAGAKGGGMEQLVGQLQQVVQALTKIVDMLKQMVGGAQGAGGPGGGAPGGGAPAGAGGPEGAAGPGGGGQGAAPAGGPGGGNGADGATATPPADGKGGGDPTRGPTGEAPIDIARSVLGQNAADLKVKGRLSEEMEDWVPNNVNCANFVSAVLQEAGQIPKGEHSASVAGLRANLSKDPHFQQKSNDLHDAKPGDVVMMNTGGDDNGHVVIFAGMKNGKPTFIGSNNVNPDGSQKVTETPMNYKITGVFSYAG
jgi:hypothetical protein